MPDLLKNTTYKGQSSFFKEKQVFLKDPKNVKRTFLPRGAEFGGGQNGKVVELFILYNFVHS